MALTSDMEQPSLERSTQILPNRDAWQAHSLAQSALSILFLANGNMTEGQRPVAALPLDAKGLNMVTPLMQTQEAASSARPALGWTFKAGRD